MDIDSKVVKASKVGDNRRNVVSICKCRRAENNWIALQMVSWSHWESFMFGHQLIDWTVVEG